MSGQNKVRVPVAAARAEREGADRPRARNGRPRAGRGAAAAVRLPGGIALSESEGIVLVIGQLDGVDPEERGYRSGEQIVFADYADVSPALLERLAPRMVLSPVITPAFDAFDLAQNLHEMGYDGAYRALTPRLPDPDLVRREVASCAPGLDFELLVVEADGAGEPH